MFHNIEYYELYILTKTIKHSEVCFNVLSNILATQMFFQGEFRMVRYHYQRKCCCHEKNKKQNNIRNLQFVTLGQVLRKI